MIVRCQNNPLLSPSSISPSREGMEVTCLLNPGAFAYEGKTWLLLRVAERPEQKDGEISFPVLDGKDGLRIIHIPSDSSYLDASDPRVIRYKGNDYLTTMSHLRLVSSYDGVSFSEDKSFGPLMGAGEYEAFGIEDCRVAKIDNRFFLTYTAVSSNGVAVGMRSTQDWRTFKKHGLILPPHNKDCALFERRINGLYYMLHRPSSPEIGGNYIWMAESPDLIHWGNHRCVARTRDGMWDSARVGAGSSPIETEEGWLEIYHGADSENRYCLGALLLDLDDPSKVIARTEKPVMVPSEPYETSGFFGKVIFSNGQIVDGDKVSLYYGASDSVICRGEISVSEVMKSLTLCNN